MKKNDGKKSKRGKKGHQLLEEKMEEKKDQNGGKVFKEEI